MRITIGTRGSKLSLKQTDIVKDKLLVINPHLQIKTKIIVTKGDKDMKPIPLDTVGKGWFTKELDKALLEGDIDMAVHSLKDLLETLPRGLVIAGVPEREDARDILVSKNNITLENLKKRAVIGTDSTRRKAQVLNKRADLIIKSVRGNVNRRLDKLEEGNYDALMLAAAGLIRLDLKSKITEYFEVSDVVPAPGQGALAVVVNKKNKKIYTLAQELNNYETVIAVGAERAFSLEIGGGCKTPTGAYAVCEENTLTLYGMIASPDGKYLVKETLQGNPSENSELGIKLARQLLNASKDWYTKP